MQRTDCGIGGFRFAAALGGLLLGCGGDVAAPTPAADPSQLYWALTLDHRAVNLSTASPYDTLQLVATPRTISGAALPDAGTPIFTSSDAATVQVSPQGLVRAIAPGSGAVVIARLSVGGVTHADTTSVSVTANPTPPVLASLSLHPVPPDSAKRAGGFAFYPWPVFATDAGGQPLPDLAIKCTSADSTIAFVVASCGFMIVRRPGNVQITASTTAYGVTKADTLTFTVGQPITAMIGLQPDTRTLGTVTIGAGGIVQWVNKTGQPADVRFDDATNVAEDPACQCGSGDIPPFGNADSTDVTGNTRRRLFPLPGTYTYHSSAVPGSGTVVVADER